MTKIAKNLECITANVLLPLLIFSNNFEYGCSSLKDIKSEKLHN